MIPSLKQVPCTDLSGKSAIHAVIQPCSATNNTQQSPPADSKLSKGVLALDIEAALAKLSQMVFSNNGSKKGSNIPACCLFKQGVDCFVLNNRLVNNFNLDASHASPMALPESSGTAIDLPI